MEYPTPHIYDVIIIGAGPCGFAVAARLCEDTPSSLFTESEHQHFHRMKASHTSKRSSKPVRNSRRSNTSLDRLLSGPAVPGKLDVPALDATSDKWMGAWNRRFEILSITHLRSPMFFHPDPRDRDGMLEYAYRQGKEKDLREIRGVIGKTLSKHQRKQKAKNGTQETTYLDERDRNDFFRPSTSFFAEYCNYVASRYNIENIVEKSTVTSVIYKPDETSESGIFTLQTSTGAKHALTVVFACGPATPPTIPLTCKFCHKNPKGVSHAFTPHPSPTSSLPDHVLHKIQAGTTTSLAVIGGELTSAQVTCAAVHAKVSKVFHFMRGPMKVKHFDADLSWVGKYRNFQQAGFWRADSDEERFEMITEARGGGNFTPEYKKLVLDLVKSGHVEMFEKTEIMDAEWDEDIHMWKLLTEPKVEGLCVDHIVYATGTQADFKSIPALQPLREMAPIESVNGLPCVTNYLQWNEGIPFFFTGRFAGLRLGPFAANLEGARTGAERVAGKLAEFFQKENSDSECGSDSYSEKAEVDMRRLRLGLGSQFDVLASCNDCAEDSDSE